MSVGNLFAKPKLFQKKEGIGAERFCEIYWDFKDKKSYLENVTLTTEVKENGIGGRFFGTSLAEFVPPRCKVNDPFEILYDKDTGKLYAVPTDGIFFKLMLDGMPVTLRTSDMASCKKTTLTGRTELVLAETFNDTFE